MNESWFVAASIVGRERQAASRLESRFEIFLPVRQIPRYTYLEKFKDFYPRALFPGYFFVNCDPDLRMPRYAEYRGLVGLGGAGIGEPIPIETKAVEELRSQLDPQGIWRLPVLKAGDTVEIRDHDSLFWGMRGLYECKSGDECVTVLLNAVTQFRVQVSRFALRAVEAN